LLEFRYPPNLASGPDTQAHGVVEKVMCVVPKVTSAFKTVGCAMALSLASVPGLSQEASVAFAEPAPAFMAHNRFLQAAFGAHEQDYRELDTRGLTADGILDRENGTQRAALATLRWQFRSGVLVQLEARRVTGPTTYRGYLQSGGSSLTPFIGPTGNQASDVSMQLGAVLPLGAMNPALDALQIVPMVQLSRHQWRRRLAQYSETYRFQAYAAGALLQWQARPGTVVEAQALLGRTPASSVKVDAFDFAATQGAGSYREWQWGISQDLASVTGLAPLQGWSVAARYVRSQYTHGTSPSLNGVQAPPNEHRPSAWTLGLQKHFD
jgi:hypothetical protein